MCFQVYKYSSAKCEREVPLDLSRQKCKMFGKLEHVFTFENISINFSFTSFSFHSSLHYDYINYSDFVVW